MKGRSRAEGSLGGANRPGRSGRPASGRRPAPRPGRPARSVYHRRRIVVAALATAILVLAGFGVASIIPLFGGEEPGAAAAGSAPTQRQRPTPTPTPTVTTGFVPTACRTSDLRLMGTSDASSYAAGGSTLFRLRVKNTGTAPCVFDGGAAAMGVLVFSGEDQVWSSVDCPASPEERPLLFDVGDAEDFVVTWSQVRSESGCPAEQPQVPAGAYRAVVTLDGGASVVPGWERAFLIR